MNLLKMALDFFNQPETPEQKRIRLNAEGSRKGFGDCMHCHDSWMWKKEKNIQYDDSHGMFPLCEECFYALSFETVIEYCQQRWDSWSYHDHEMFPIDRIAKEVIRLRNERKDA